MTEIKASIGRDHYRIALLAGAHTVIADEPVSGGGGDEGMNPFELLACALGACTCATVRMYADRREMKLDSMEVAVTLTRDDTKKETAITRTITLHGDLTADEKARLLQIAEKCPVHTTLTNPIHIHTILIG